MKIRNMRLAAILIASAVGLGTGLYSGANAQGYFYVNPDGGYYAPNTYYGNRVFYPTIPYYGGYPSYHSHHVGPHRGLHWTRDAGLHWGHHIGEHRINSRRAHRGVYWY